MRGRERLDGKECSSHTAGPGVLFFLRASPIQNTWKDGACGPAVSHAPSTEKAISLIVQPLLSKALALSSPISLLHSSSGSLVLCLGLQAWSMWWHSDGGHRGTGNHIPGSSKVSLF